MPVQICKNERKIRVLKTIILLLTFVNITYGCGYGVYHRVRKGETIEDIAKMYGVPPETIIAENSYAPYGFNTKIKEGDWIYIPLDKAVKKDKKIHEERKIEIEEERSFKVVNTKSEKETENQKPEDEKGKKDQQNLIKVSDDVKPTMKKREIGKEIEGEKKNDEELFRREDKSRSGNGNGRWEKYARAPIRSSPTTFIWPVKGKVISGFGKRGERMHKGIDIEAPEGTDVLSAGDGVVIFSGFLRGYGNVVIMKHEGNYFTVYAHMRYNMVKEGEFVKKGEVIGKVGRTGNATTPHLHFEIRVGTKPLNPITYIQTQNN